MRRIVLVGIVLGSILVTLLGPATATADNSDAAHACQQGGYLTLFKTDGTGFKNTGECVSYAARGGTIVGISGPCSYTSGTSGCIVYNNVVLRQYDISTQMYISTTTITLSGAFTFTPICIVTCGGFSAVGGGTFSVADGTSFSGTWTADVYNPGPFDFLDSSGSSTTCAASSTQVVTIAIHLYDSSGNLVGGTWVETRLVAGGGTPTTNFVLGFFTISGVTGGFFYTADTSGVTLRC